MRTVIVFVIYIILVIAVLPLFLVCLLFGWREPILVYGRWAMKVSRFVLGIKVEVSGLSNMDPRRPYIFMSNHLSFLDGPLLFMVIPRSVRVILKKSIFRLPVVGFGMKFIRFVPVDRKRVRNGVRSIEQAARLVRQKGYSFLIFPEGTRSRDGRLQSFRRGGFFLALATDAPIVPVTIRGSYELMPKGSFFVRRGKVDVVFHEPVPVDGYDHESMPELMARVREAIASVLPDSVS